MPTQTTTLGQRAEERVAQENAWQQFQCQVKYNKDMATCIKNIGDTLFPDSPKNSSIYQEAIIKGLTSTIQEEVGILDFWKKIDNAKCKNVTIEDGQMNFYNEKAEKIDITTFTNQLEFPANSSVYDQREIERKNQILEAKKQLEELLKEIRK